MGVWREVYEKKIIIYIAKIPLWQQFQTDILKETHFQGKDYENLDITAPIPSAAAAVALRIVTKPSIFFRHTKQTTQQQPLKKERKMEFLLLLRVIKTCKNKLCFKSWTMLS